MRKILTIALLDAWILALLSCGTRNWNGTAEELVYDSLTWCDSVVFEGGSSAASALSTSSTKSPATQPGCRRASSSG